MPLCGVFSHWMGAASGRGGHLGQADSPHMRQLPEGPESWGCQLLAPPAGEEEILHSRRGACHRGFSICHFARNGSV